jgi:hypothetical protein
VSTAWITLTTGSITHDGCNRGRRGVTGAPQLHVGLMLRAVDDVDGQGIYIRKLCEALFDLDQHNRYVAFYSRPEQVGRYADRPNVREIVVPGGG